MFPQEKYFAISGIFLLSYASLAETTRLGRGMLRGSFLRVALANPHFLHAP